jgi:hypothetical protein
VHNARKFSRQATTYTSEHVGFVDVYLLSLARRHRRAMKNDKIIDEHAQQPISLCYFECDATSWIVVDGNIEVNVGFAHGACETMLIEMSI